MEAFNHICFFLSHQFIYLSMDHSGVKIWIFTFDLQYLTVSVWRVSELSLGADLNTSSTRLQLAKNARCRVVFSFSNAWYLFRWMTANLCGIGMSSYLWWVQVILNWNLRPSFHYNQWQNLGFGEKKGEPNGYSTIKKNVLITGEIEEQMKLIEERAINIY